MESHVKMQEPLTAIVPTFNNEKIIERCLRAVSWADEILVVDSFSQDRTLEIASQFGARIIQHEYVNSANQKNWAIPQARSDWIFLLDSDEELEDGFREEVQDILANPPAGIDGFIAPRKNLIYGKWVATCGIYPDSIIRLFKKSCRYEEREVHAHLDVPPERLGRLKHHIIHHDLTDLSAYLEKLPRYMRYEVKQLVREGRKFRVREITLRPIYMFCWTFFYKQGFRDGLRGFLLSVLHAYYNFIMYMELWEHENSFPEAPTMKDGRETPVAEEHVQFPA